MTAVQPPSHARVQRWRAVDRYVEDLLIPHEQAPDEVLSVCAAAGLPDAQVSASYGRLLSLLVSIAGARSVLELGTLGGYSAIWLAQALPPGGRLLTLEAAADHATIARANVERTGLTGVVEVRIGDALQTLPALVDEGAGPFDLIFLDADKTHNAVYLPWLLELSRTGTLIVADNVVRGGAILDPHGEDPKLGPGGISGLRRFYELVGAEPRLRAPPRSRPPAARAMTGSSSHWSPPPPLTADRHFVRAAFCPPDRLLRSRL